MTHTETGISERKQWLVSRAKPYALWLWLLGFSACVPLVFFHLVFYGGPFWQFAIRREVSQYYHRELAAKECSDKINVSTSFEILSPVVQQCRTRGPVTGFFLASSVAINSHSHNHEGVQYSPSVQMCFNVSRAQGPSQECWVADRSGLELLQIENRGEQQ